VTSGFVKPRPPAAAEAQLPPAETSRRRDDQGLWWSIPSIPGWLIRSAFVAAAAATGRFLADGKTKYGVAILAAGLLAPIVFFDLPLGLAAWAGLLYVKGLHFLSKGPNALGVLVGLSFIGAFLSRAPALPVLRQQRRFILVTLLFLVWGTLGVAYAPQPGTAANEASYLWIGGLALIITMTALVRTRDVAIVVLAFVGGATLSALIGLASGGIAAAAAAANTTSIAVYHGRLTGAGNDPNLQAAGFLAALFLAMGLFSIYRRRLARMGLLVAFALILVAFFATGSRGGLLALIVATIVAVAVSRQRRAIIGMVMVGILISGVALALKPGLFSRITDFSGGTSGRSDIWHVAETVFVQHPLIGVGLDNFPVVEPRYALMHRSVSRVTYIAETPFPAHNTYLQILDEEGVIGFLLFAAFLYLSLRSSWQAIKLFERRNMADHAQLARSIMMGTIGMLTAIFFFTDYDDWRLWILLGLGPAMLALARQERLSGPRAV
jgi:oligosaccharide repeat unit polymerase